MEPVITFGKKLKPLDLATLSGDPDWKQCDPRYIRRALKRALARPSGGWYVVDDSCAIGTRPSFYQIDGRELVAYRLNGQAQIGSHACPHIGGPLSRGRVRDGKLVCPWHGLRLPSPDHEHWRTFDVHEDGVLTWVRLGSEQEATPEPILPERPTSYMDGVIRTEADCEPGDVIANRLDPWHGHHYHPHTFARLTVTEVTDDLLTLRVAFRVLGPFCVEVDATFHSPEPRTIVMTIVDGEGIGSVVETHATPIAPGRTAVIEAILATSEKMPFQILRVFASSLIRPMIQRTAHRLWVEDTAYAERTFALRKGKTK